MIDLIEEAKDAISAVFGEMDVTKHETNERLEELQGFIQDMRDSLGE